MRERSSVEAAELVTKQLLRAQLAELRTELVEALPARPSGWAAIAGATARLAAIGTLT